MIATQVFEDTLKAYNDGFSIIANKGSSRSSKTFSELQLIKLLCDHDKNSINTVVSHSFPHLEGGAIRDFENILRADGIEPELIKHVKPCFYKLGSNIVEFVGFDNPGKALGAARKRLLINEANKMPFSVCQQLMIRTEEVTFLDWNPSEEFWFDEHNYEEMSNVKVIHSTFLKNINPLTGKSNLSETQLQNFLIAKQKHDKELASGKFGFWYNWWRVYGLGLKGRLEGVIFPDWQEYDELPDCDLYTLYGIDWGGNDPTTLTECNFDGENNRLYVKEHIYQPQILNSKLIDYCLALGDVMFICDSARKDKIFELQMAGINAMGCTKGEGSILDGIERMKEFDIFVHKDSKNAQNEFNSYKWAVDKQTGKSLNVPEDANNHAIDGIRYATRFYRRAIRP